MSPAMNSAFATDIPIRARTPLVKWASASDAQRTSDTSVAPSGLVMIDSWDWGQACASASGCPTRVVIFQSVRDPYACPVHMSGAFLQEKPTLLEVGAEADLEHPHSSRS